MIVGALLTLFIALTPQGRAGFHTTLFLTQVLGTPIKPQPWLTGEPVRHEVRFPSPEGISVSEVYRLPDGRPRAAVLLSLGITDQGFEDANVINLGYALARAGYVVMYQWSPHSGLNHNIDPDGPEILLSSFQYLESREYVDPERVGLGGFCIGASFALVAASDPRIREGVHFVNALGPYFDAESLLVQAASRKVVYGGEETSWEPGDLTIRVLANELIETLEHPGDIDILSDAYDRETPTTPRELDSLTPPGRRVASLMEGVGQRKAEELVSSLPSGFSEGMLRISPSAHVGGLQARLLVMHDEDDQLVPAAESRRLVKAVPGDVRVRHTELLAFDHIAPDAGGVLTILGQAGRLYRHMYEIIRIAQ